MSSTRKRATSRTSRIEVSAALVASKSCARSGAATKAPISSKQDVSCGPDAASSPGVSGMTTFCSGMTFHCQRSSQSSHAAARAAVAAVRNAAQEGAIDEGISSPATPARNAPAAVSTQSRLRAGWRSRLSAASPASTSILPAHVMTIWGNDGGRPSAVCTHCHNDIPHARATAIKPIPASRSAQRTVSGGDRKGHANNTRPTKSSAAASQPAPGHPGRSRPATSRHNRTSSQRPATMSRSEVSLPRLRRHATHPSATITIQHNSARACPASGPDINPALC